MKIQKQLSKKVRDKVYYKYVVVIPEDLVKSSGLREGQELEGEFKEGEIRIKRKH